MVVARKWEFPNRQTKARWDKREVIRAVMPGYVFLGVRAGRTPSINAALRFDMVRGVVSENGEPAIVPHDPRGSHPGLRGLMWAQAGGKFNAPDYHRWQDTGATFSIGDEAKLDSGLQGKVIDIQDRQARILCDFLGATRVVDVDLVKLRAVR